MSLYKAMSDEKIRGKGMKGRVSVNSLLVAQISFRSGGTECICKDGLLSVIHPNDHSLLTRSTGLSFLS